MRLWMHGTGQDIPKSVQMLKSIGFEAVVDNDPRLIQAAGEVGLEVYQCSGAFTASGIFAGEQYLAQDVHGERHRWFNSTCPNQPEVRQANLDAAAAMALTPGIRGILIDGARFASPASSRNPKAFYTCFCPVCMQKAEALGFSPSRMRAGVSSMYHCIHHGSLHELLPDLQGLMDWFSFRRKCTTEHLLNFSRTVKNVNPGLQTGIYIFTPALSYLVGQNYQDLRDDFDIFAPMIYRSYPGKDGPACLNHELSALVNELSRTLLLPQAAVSVLSALLNLPMEQMTDGADVLHGLPPQAIASETRRAKSTLGPCSQLVPIIQLDDPFIAESIQAVKSSNADGVNFFAYNEEVLLTNRQLFETEGGRDC